MYKGIQVIAEVKTLSPFGYQSTESWDVLFALADEVGDMLSIHTDPRWGGSFELLAKARAQTNKSILAKGIHADDADIERALSLGADSVLVVGRVPSRYAERCLIEPLSLAELELLPLNLMAVWNTRDLSNGEQKIETFEQARTLFPGWLCQASNIRTTADIKEGADAVLVGTHLRAFAESLIQDS